MKKILSVTAVMLLSLFSGINGTVSGAAVKTETPGTTIKNFYTAMANSNFDAAKKYVAADEMKKLISFLENMTKEVPALKEDTKKDFMPLANAKINSEKITGDKAVVKYTYTKDKKSKTETLNLKKVNGLWIII